MSNNANSKPTCGVLYSQAAQTITGKGVTDDFARGFVAGASEKIYLGACRAAMFRPSEGRREMLLAAVRAVARVYGLVVVEPIGVNAEIWICRPDAEPRVLALTGMTENT